MTKASYKCNGCKKDFTLNREEVYVVWNLVLEHSPESNMLHWRWVKPKEDLISAVQFFYHKECFRNLAGDSFLSYGISNS